MDRSQLSHFTPLCFYDMAYNTQVLICKCLQYVAFAFRSVRVARKFKILGPKNVLTLCNWSRYH